MKKKEVKEPVASDSKPMLDSEHAELKDLMIKSIKWSEAVYNQNKKIQRNMMWMSVAGFIRLFLILVPLIIGIIYLPPLLSGVWAQYQSVLGIGGGSVGIDTHSVKTLLEQFGSNTNGVDIEKMMGAFSGN